MNRYALIIMDYKAIFCVPIVVTDDYMFSRIIDYCVIHNIDHTFKNFKTLKHLENFILSGIVDNE